ncbi:hypothetical protein H0H87_010355, partial [Tephrocybe sp. NHM501043]
MEAWKALMLRISNVLCAVKASTTRPHVSLNQLSSLHAASSSPCRFSMFEQAKNITINGGTFTQHTHVNSGHEAISEWMSSDEGKPILWLHGKSRHLNSAIAQYMPQMFIDRKQLAGSFFFSKHPKCNSIDHFTPTLALQLTFSLPGFQLALSKSLHSDQFFLERSIPEQFQMLILDPLQGITAPTPSFLIIDALEKCAGKENQHKILQQLLQLVDTKEACLRVAVVSSSAPHLRRFFRKKEIQA